ncbi:uncharacterized protein LACBIDRAFT_253742 [Laccaria bicolor S238N-H82]|uniref:Predicted protein n=1 Tax=Laccaria bicolor (strain S238N-H82 / ATCC MYA-4686) TaxID=486041 RepID=B0DRP2_LACBS|nr:uncharacterized protein LACBIDRAFT_253742 [Laccaria bicolor S238N-H82]EDR02822.1 predicted protein [Laccaria bicolor S238N-H82]|eukprot:XP_001886532.1 predicted protein [Laccaria bicolor S238N-H82]
MSGFALQCLALLMASAATYLVFMTVYWLFFHPLSKVPGPKLAAISGLYMAYYDIVMLGGMVDQLEVLHEKYGRVFDQIYRSRFTKEAWFYDAFLASESSFACIDPRKAKIQKDIMRPLFSRKAILKLENVIQRGVIVTTYCFAKSFEAIDYPNFQHPMLLSLDSSGFMIFLMQHFPFVIPFILGIPHWLARRISPDSLEMQFFLKTLESQIDKILANPTTLESEEHPTIYHHFLATDAQVKVSKKALQDESAVLLAAGTDTVGNACMIGTVHLLSNRALKDELVSELRAAWPDLDSPLSLEKLEKLPYLTAVIKESLRLSHGVVSPAPRVVPFNTMIAGVFVPAGTVVAMGATFMHYNPKVFTNPKRFDPDRWLQPNITELEENFVPFSKGPRSCLGINLAWAELYLMFSNIFRKTDMELFNTTYDISH